jgi:hypothetical protein
MSKDMKWGDFNLVKREQINAYLLSDSHKIDKRKCLELSPSQVSLTQSRIRAVLRLWTARAAALRISLRERKLDDIQSDNFRDSLL